MAAVEQKLERLWNRNYIKVWIGNFFLHFSFMLLMPLLPVYLSETFGATKEQIGIVLSGYVITALITRLFSGYIVDSFPRKTVLILAYSAFALLFAGYILAGSVLIFSIVRTLHGVPFGAATVAATTVAIDVLPSSRRAEGIGYFGLSNNLATAIGPTVALLIFGIWDSFNVLFVFSLVISFLGFAINASITLPQREIKRLKQRMSLDRFFLTKGWRQSLNICCFSFSYGTLSTYIAIYCRDTFGMDNGTGFFFALLAVGLMLSRITGGRGLRRGLIVENARNGMLVSIVGYTLFAAVPQLWAFYVSPLIIGLGNGHMYPAFQNMFINLAPNERRGTANSTILVSWDTGLGLGILVGGFVSEFFGYRGAFWTGAIVNAVGVAIFLLSSQRHYLANRLR